MATPDLDLTPTEETTYCAVHPDRETGLRCNKCGRYMCVQCAVRTPVGYRCKECVRGIEDKFFQATQYDYIIIAAVCAVLGGIGGAIVKAIGIPLLFMLILGLPIGGGIAEVALRAIQRRRGRQSAQIAAAATAIGGIIGATIYAYITISNAYNQLAAQLPPQARGDYADYAPTFDTVFSFVINDIGLLVFVGMITFAVYGRFKMRM
ncbi:MAG TPA: B-box zinc finger protein [Oceanobacillus sp.]|nr:B-box zinc finger protein [Oceanobacillus sp.]